MLHVATLSNLLSSLSRNGPLLNATFINIFSSLCLLQQPTMNNRKKFRFNDNSMCFDLTENKNHCGLTSKINISTIEEVASDVGHSTN
ncbi:hypothetical protein L1887_07332 [Cichorium endivia]|nr:hypothetical protein L1887_07332 [Cichorium endivia]